jgi:hypothetical protein
VVKACARSDRSRRLKIITIYPFIFAAAELSFWDQLKGVSREAWSRWAIQLLIVVVLVGLWRVLRKINGLLPWLCAVLACSVILLSWIHSRGEPAMMTPLIEKLAPFMPNEKSDEAKRRAGR